MKYTLLIFSFLLFGFVQKNETIISGRIVDSNNNPIAFSYVYINNSIDVTYSDSNGYFILTSNQNNDIVLKINNKGYIPYDTILKPRKKEQYFKIILNKEKDINQIAIK